MSQRVGGIYICATVCVCVCVSSRCASVCECVLVCVCELSTRHRTVNLMVILNKAMKAARRTGGFLFHLSGSSLFLYFYFYFFCSAKQDKGSLMDSIQIKCFVSAVFSEQTTFHFEFMQSMSYL